MSGLSLQPLEQPLESVESGQTSAFARSYGGTWEGEVDARNSPSPPVCDAAGCPLEEGAGKLLGYFSTGNQVFVAYLWKVSKILGQEKRVLDLLHDGYLSGCCNSGETKDDKVRLATAAQSELHERYGKYYNAWDDDMKTKSGLALSFEMAQFFFPRRKPVLDALLQASIQVHIGAFMVSALEFRKRFEITGT
jgi:hypothetical protein